ncbi:MAG TPA: class I SAM-dependent methyltransferase [Gemmataceae bacterium]|nr:class I SAM-dependent methyltransferase [Gemmataceae bacterium]
MTRVLTRAVATPSPSNCTLVDKAFADFRGQLKEGYDRAYFDSHERRYRQCIQRVLSLVPAGSRVLDIGSHYLHQSGLLRLLGYEVWALDVPAFTQLDFVKGRAQELAIRLSSAFQLESGEFLSDQDGSFDLVLFCEIMEHITFNPIGFWKRVYELLKVNGRVYITTPNSLRLLNLLSTIKRAICLQGIGTDVPSIFGNVTYGHHWKEYSDKEVIRYFALLSPDFHVDVRFYHYRVYSNIHTAKDVARHLTRLLGKGLRKFDEELEIVVTLERRSCFLGQTPAYG